MPTSTTLIPLAAAMADDMAVGHGKSLCSSSRLGSTLKLSLTSSFIRGATLTHY
jgi:hypothetical protein